MSDLKNFIQMLNNSDECFSKTKSGDDWLITIIERKMEFYFKKDGSFRFCWVIQKN